MQKLVTKGLTLTIIVNLLIGTIFVAMIGNATLLNITAEYGSAPSIDGVIDRQNNEWNNAVKESLYLFPNMTDPINGLLIDLWVMQTESNLYLSIQFQLEDHTSGDYNSEFIGVLIADKRDAATQEDFTDAKVVHFNNLSSGTFQFSDYYINNSVFYIDAIQNGKGAAQLEGNDITYEFSIPIGYNGTNVQDVNLNFGPGAKNIYRIVFGVGGISFNDFRVQNEVTIELQFPPYVPPLSITEILLLTFNIIIFGAVGGFYIFYIYRITKLKKEIKRIKR